MEKVHAVSSKVAASIIQKAFDAHVGKLGIKVKVSADDDTTVVVSYKTVLGRVMFALALTQLSERKVEIEFEWFNEEGLDLDNARLNTEVPFSGSLKDTVREWNKSSNKARAELKSHIVTAQAAVAAFVATGNALAQIQAAQV